MNFAAIAAFAVLILSTTARAQGTKDRPPCTNQQTTFDIVQCIGKDMRVWDQRLNAAYRALGPAVDPEQREPLKVAQRLWVQYRDANCGFYAAHEGTIRQILAANCMWTMTRDRALELEAAAKP